MTAEELIDYLVLRGCLVGECDGRITVDGQWEAVESTHGWVLRSLCHASTPQGLALLPVEGLVLDSRAAVEVALNVMVGR